MRHPLLLAGKSILRPDKKIKPRVTREELDLHAVARYMGSDAGLIRVLLIIVIGYITFFASSPLAQERSSVRSKASQAETGSLSPYIQRGNEVSARFHAFSAILTEFHRDLQVRLMKAAPDLARQFKDKPGSRKTAGY